jgi:mannose-6-phosphate isomerase-like protein (cupin superfamily)
MATRSARIDWSVSRTPSPPPPPRPASPAACRRPGAGRGPHGARVGRSRPAAGWRATSTRSRRRCTSSAASSLLEIGGDVHRLVAGRLRLVRSATWHALANAGDEQVRWLSVNTPQRWRPTRAARTRSSSRRRRRAALSRAPAAAVRRPAPALVGHYDGTPPQAEALRRHDPPAAAARRHGHGAARLQRDLGEDAGRPRVRRRPADDVHGRLRARRLGQQHDHPFEEAYVFLAGEVEAELDGTAYTSGPATWCSRASAAVHGFYNTGTERVRWIETQAPQAAGPPRYRWAATGSGSRRRRCRMTERSSSSAGRGRSGSSWSALRATGRRSS